MTVMDWLLAEIIHGAQLVESLIGSYYKIPAQVVVAGFLVTMFVTQLNGK